MYVYKNPTLKERAEISQKYPEVDWSKFPPAPDQSEKKDECGDEFLTDYFNEFCDNAKQTAFHTASGMDAAIKLFVKSRPWLNVERKMFVQSDGAVNYRDPTTEIDIVQVCIRCITEAGEGKDQIDSNCAIVKRLLKQARNRGWKQRSASDYLKCANEKLWQEI